MLKHIVSLCVTCFFLFYDIVISHNICLYDSELICHFVEMKNENAYSSKTRCRICFTCGTPLSWNHLMASIPSSATWVTSLDEA